MEEWTLDLIPCLNPLIQVYYFESRLCDNGGSVIIYRRHCFSLNTAFWAFTLEALLETLLQSCEPGAQVSDFLVIFKGSRNVFPLPH